ncbi:TadE/TadG family type IV pilus assembly protein, partial [Gilliamella apicola]
MNNNNQLNNKNHKDSFLKCTSGSIAISMAIMLPAIFICMAFSINQAYTMRNRAMISEATNEASLAVIAIDNRNVNDEAKKQNRTLALNYINYFISKEIGDGSKTDANLLKPGSEVNVD